MDAKQGLPVSHVEVIFILIMERKGGTWGPILLEMAYRRHTIDCVPLASMSIGYYNTLNMLLAAYLRDNEKLPQKIEHLWLDSNPPVSVTIVHLVSFVEGEVVAIDRIVLEEIENLPSVVGMEMYDSFSVGNKIEKTDDIWSYSGWVHLIIDDENQFISFYNCIVEFMPSIFIVQWSNELCNTWDICGWCRLMSLTTPKIILEL